MGLQVPCVAAATPFWQVVEEDVMALMVVLQNLQLCLPLPRLLAFFLLFFRLFSFLVCHHGGLTLGLFLLPFLALVCLAVVGFTPSITAGGASPLLFNQWFSRLIWREDFLGRCLFTLLGGILFGSILFGSTLGQCALRRRISGLTLLTLLELCQ